MRNSAYLPASADGASGCSTAQLRLLHPAEADCGMNNVPKARAATRLKFSFGLPLSLDIWRVRQSCRVGYLKLCFFSSMSPSAVALQMIAAMLEASICKHKRGFALKATPVLCLC